MIPAWEDLLPYLDDSERCMCDPQESCAACGYTEFDVTWLNGNNAENSWSKPVLRLVCSRCGLRCFRKPLNLQ